MVMRSGDRAGSDVDFLSVVVVVLLGGGKETHGVSVVGWRFGGIGMKIGRWRLSEEG